MVILESETWRLVGQRCCVVASFENLFRRTQSSSAYPADEKINFNSCSFGEYPRFFHQNIAVGGAKYVDWKTTAEEALDRCSGQRPARDLYTPPIDLTTFLTPGVTLKA